MYSVRFNVFYGDLLGDKVFWIYKVYVKYKVFEDLLYFYLGCGVCIVFI